MKKMTIVVNLSLASRMRTRLWTASRLLPQEMKERFFLVGDVL